MYERILIVVDEGAIARAAIEEGVALAKAQASQVLFFHVLPNYVVPMADMPPVVSLGPDEYRREVERTGQRTLTEAAAHAQAMGVPSTGAMDAGIDAAEVIARAASERQCQLIVVGSHGRTALQRLIFGSLVTRLITLAPVPVLVCKRPGKAAQEAEVGDTADHEVKAGAPRAAAG